MSHFHFKAGSRDVTTLQLLLTKVKVLFGESTRLETKNKKVYLRLLLLKNVPCTEVMVVGGGAEGTDVMNQIQPNDFISKNNNMLAEMLLSQGFGSESFLIISDLPTVTK